MSILWYSGDHSNLRQQSHCRLTSKLAIEQLVLAPNLMLYPKTTMSTSRSKGLQNNNQLKWIEHKGSQKGVTK